MKPEAWVESASSQVAWRCSGAWPRPALHIAPRYAIFEVLRLSNDFCDCEISCELMRFRGVVLVKVFVMLGRGIWG